MLNPQRKRYLYLMIAGFGAISMSIVLYFLLLRLSGFASFLGKIGNILRPFLYGGVIAYLLRPCCNWMEASLEASLPKQMRRYAKPMSVTGSLLVGVLAVYTLIIMIAPQLVSSIVSIWKSLPQDLNQLQVWIEKTINDKRFVEMFNVQTDELYAELVRWVQEKIVPKTAEITGAGKGESGLDIVSMMTSASSIVSGVGNGVYRVFQFVYSVLVGTIVAVYLLAGRRQFSAQGKLVLHGLLPQKLADSVLAEIRLIDSLFNGFINGKILDSAIVGVICYICCLIFRFPNALLVSVIIGVTNVIPFFGPFIGAVPTVLLILTESPIKAVWFAVFILVLQQVDGNIIGPRILGDKTGLSGFWVLFAIVLFGGMWGVVGMIIAVPLFAVVYDLVRRVVRRGLREKQHTEMWEKYVADFPLDTRK